MPHSDEPAKFKLDTTGLRCPLVVMRLQKEWKLKGMPLEFDVISDDSDAPADLGAFAQRNKMKIVQEGTLFRFRPL